MFVNQDTLRLDYQVEAQDEGLKIIDVLATSMDISSRLIRKCKNHKNILLNKRDGSVNRIVHEGDTITLFLDHDENTFDPHPLVLDIVYEDGDCLAVNKPPFLVVHPTKGHPDGTLANALSYHQYLHNQNYKIRFINRLDRDTSGIVLVAKNAFAQQRVSDQMIANTVDKIYFAVVDGVVASDKGTINEPIERIEALDIKRGVIHDGMPSITHYEVVERYKAHTLMRITLETGRTHQIRVHFAHVGHPITGDTLYGQPSTLINRQALHCAEMHFIPPRQKELTGMKAPLPEDFKNLLSMIKGI